MTCRCGQITSSGGSRNNDIDASEASLYFNARNKRKEEKEEGRRKGRKKEGEREKRENFLSLIQSWYSDRI